MDTNYRYHHKGSKFMAMLFGFIAGIATVMLISRRARKDAMEWTQNMRDEVMRKAKEQKDLTQEKYNQIIEQVKPKYQSMKNVTSQELSALSDELKSHWTRISQEAKKPSQPSSGDKETYESQMTQGTDTEESNTR